MYKMARKLKKAVKIGNVEIGGNAPVSVQTMIKAPLGNLKEVLAEAKKARQAGCEILRVAVENQQGRRAIEYLKKHINIPIEADVHFDWRLAFLSLDAGADAVRLNPNNIAGKKQILAVVKECREKNIPIRIGINSGGFRQKLGDAGIVRAMLSKVSRYVKIMEDAHFYDIMISLKTSSVNSTVQVNRLASKRFDYPLHLGITATGPKQEGIIKSCVGLGILLSEGIGDTIRVSLNAQPWEEVEAGKGILQALGLRVFGPEIISCPKCSRCEVDLESIVEQFKRKLLSMDLKRNNFTVAVMGCEVNGPGEAAHADLGVAFGGGFAAFFEQGKIVKRVAKARAIDELLKAIRNRFN